MSTGLRIKIKELDDVSDDIIKTALKSLSVSEREQLMRAAGMPDMNIIRERLWSRVKEGCLR